MVQIFDENSKAVSQLPKIDLEELVDRIKPIPQLVIAREVVPYDLYYPPLFSRYDPKPKIPEGAKIAHETIYMGRIARIKELTSDEAKKQLNKDIEMTGEVSVFSENLELEEKMHDRVVKKPKDRRDIVTSVRPIFHLYGVPVYKVKMNTELIAGRFVGYREVESVRLEGYQPDHWMEILYGDATHMEIITEPKSVIPRVWIYFWMNIETTYHEPTVEQYNSIKSLYIEAGNWLNK